VPRLYYLVPFIKGILPARAFAILLNTFLNPKLSSDSHNDTIHRRNSTSPTQPIHRKRNHLSACH